MKEEHCKNAISTLTTVDRENKHKQYEMDVVMFDKQSTHHISDRQLLWKRILGVEVRNMLVERRLVTCHPWEEYLVPAKDEGLECEVARRNLVSLII